MNRICPKVSVIIPVYNVEKYLRQCLDSVVGQTLKDIEIICVNDGSTDASPDILAEYAADPRVKVIHKANSGYGHTMNVGLDAASGEYVSFLESDDCIETEMLQTLYTVAKEKLLDIIKADYFNLYGEGESHSLKPVQLISDSEKYGKVWNPREQPWLFYVPMMNCLGLFRRSFLEKHRIRHNETPGASHQDMGFWFQTFSLARSIYYYNRPFYQYRQDNMASSINNHTKVFCVRDEYRFIFNFLHRYPEIREWVAPIYYHRMFGSFYFTYGKLVDYLKPIFLKTFSDEFRAMQSELDFTTERFSLNEKKILEQIVENPQGYYLSQQGLYDEENRHLAEKLEKCSQRIRYYQNELRHCLELLETEKSAHSLDISVIIPIYNTAPYLRQCLKSILNQTHSSIEVLCINDGSTDNSLEILDEFSAREPRIRVFSQTNMGQSVARNVGIRHARGRYLYFMDSDDLLAADALDQLFREAQKSDLDILYFDGSAFFDSPALQEKYGHMCSAYRRPREYGEVYTGPELFCLFKKDQCYRVSPCLQFIKKEYLLKHKISFYEGIIYEDNLFSLQCILGAQRVSHRNVPFFERRIRGNSTTTMQIQFRHFYGYFTCYHQMLFLLSSHYFADECEEAVFDEINLVKNSALRIYKSLSGEEKKKLCGLTRFEQEIFQKLLLESNATFILGKSTDFASALELSEARREIRNIQASLSFRIGRLITFFPRKIRGGIRCYRENGLHYTVDLILRKLKLNW